MRSDDSNRNNPKKSKRKFRILPESNVQAAFVIAGLFAEAVFLLLLLALDVFPFKYVLAIVLLLVVIDALALILANSRKEGTASRIVSLILIMLVINILFVGDYYVYSTYDTLQKISKAKATWEIYEVITTKGGSYLTVDDIEGETVYTVDMDSKQLTEAKERLVTKADVTYEEDSNMMDTAEHLITADGERKDNIALLTKDQYKLVCKQKGDFKSRTQVIYKIKVKKRANDSAKRIDVTEESFNVLISGKDFWGKLKDSKTGLSDVNMVMTINPKTKEVLLTSIPRDSYIPLHSYGAKDKLTHSGIYGAEETKATIEDFLDIDINYNITVNFSMLVDIIDAIDGIDVYSDYEFTSAIHDSSYKKGWNHLGGKDALYFARERKAFLEGDMQRNKDQQKVLEATIKKVTSSKVIMTRYTSILNAVADEMSTDLSDTDLKKLAKLTLSDMKTPWTVKTVNVTGGTGPAPCYSMGNQELSCVFPSEESVNEAKEAIHDTMYPVNNTKSKNKKKDAEGSGDKDSGSESGNAENNKDSE